MKKYVIIVAGGKGLRMGSEIPKQFLCIHGKPVLMHTLERFHSAESHSEMEIILVLPKAQQAYWQELTERYNFHIPYRLADGGETRFHSVKNGLDLIPHDTEGIVGVHDGVRPLVSTSVIANCYAEAKEKEAVVPVIEVVETVRRLHTAGCLEGESETVPRDAYKLVQTPQTFTISLLKQAYNLPYSTQFTDDASVVEALGKRIHLVAGNRENIKITNPTDLQIAEVFSKG